MDGIGVRCSLKNRASRTLQVEIELSQALGGSEGMRGARTLVLREQRGAELALSAF
jgi:hypothetical protein